MALFVLQEFIDVIIMSLGVGYIFMDFFRAPARHDYEPLLHHAQQKWKNLAYAIAITAPAIIFHELGHKFVALGYGLSATFHAAYSWLAIGVILKILGTGFIFFVPGYVSISGMAPPIESAIIAFAGPAVNLFLFVLAWLLLKLNVAVSQGALFSLHFMKRINLFLFFLNMLPFWIFDGSKVFQGLVSHFG